MPPWHLERGDGARKYEAEFQDSDLTAQIHEQEKNLDRSSVWKETWRTDAPEPNNTKAPKIRGVRMAYVSATK
jgi:hypothetical protein